MNDKEKIVNERIKKLFQQAEKIFNKDPKLANKYVDLARKLAMKLTIRFPRNLKRRFCKHCYYYLKSGINCRIRTKDKKVVYYCLNCKKYMRFPLMEK